MIDLEPISPKRRDKILGAGVFMVGLGEVPILANHISEPYDVFDHATNLGGSMIIGCIAAMVAGKRVEKTQSETTALRARAFLGGVGFAACAVINAVTEYKTSASILGSDFGGVAGVRDWYYGTVGGTVTAAFSHKIHAIQNKAHSPR